VSVEDYNTYLKQSKPFKTFWEYLESYNRNDVIIMLDPINTLIKNMWEYRIDMLRGFSLASNSSATKFAMAYKDFDVNRDYSINEPLPEFKLSKHKWQKMCKGYRKQDNEAGRDFESNVNAKDYEYYLEKFKGECAMCKEKFSFVLPPTLDRIDNSLGHTNGNVKACCCLCNTSPSDRDFDEAKLDVQLRKFAVKNHLPTTIGAGDVSYSKAEKTYHLLRNGITGGLSNVMHRVNIAGETKINHFITKSGKVYSKDTDNVMTHVMGLDFNSLYPFAMGSIRRPWIQYDNGIMYMPATLKDYIDDPRAAHRKFKEIFETRFAKSDEEAKKGLLMVVSVKGHIDELYKNYCINFPPIFRNIDINTSDENVVGKLTHDLIENADSKCNRGTERKLTQLLSTHDQFMTCSSYYLFFLIDRCHFVVDEVDEIATFDKTDCFKEFVTSFMSRRMQAIMDEKDGVGTYCKMMLCSTYISERSKLSLEILQMQHMYSTRSVYA
jgi:hypothetical protein